MSFVMISLVGSLFMCSFSSIFSAILLIVSTFSVIYLMYWNLVNMIPLFLFSLFMLGGLYVLIGFVMMADMNDMDMIMSGNKIKECVLSFLMVLLGLNMSLSMVDDLDFDQLDFSPVKMNDWGNWSLLSGCFLFLIILLFIYLFVLHVMMKSSSSGGGFVKWGESMMLTDIIPFASEWSLMGLTFDELKKM